MIRLSDDLAALLRATPTAPLVELIGVCLACGASLARGEALPHIDDAHLRGLLHAARVLNDASARREGTEEGPIPVWLQIIRDSPQRHKGAED